LPQRKYWSQLDRATFAFGYGLMVTPLQLAHVYATIGGSGLSVLSRSPASIPRLSGTASCRKRLRMKWNMMESVALPGGGGVKAAVRDYRVAVKTGTAKIDDSGKYVDKYVAYTAGVAPASNPRFALVVVINDPQNGAYYGGAVSAPVFSEIMGNVLRLEKSNLMD
jgi:cell division protein FtsI (penicillin-binding protein 3)